MGKRLYELNLTEIEKCRIYNDLTQEFLNNKNVKKLQKIAFCAGSGTEFIQEAYENGADALVTGDLKFHTALDSPIVVFDIGHFEIHLPQPTQPKMPSLLSG